jgi:coenzyme F420 hydrogenase subunit beta
MVRALEAELGFERLHVIGTPCSDNTTTENFHKFLALLAEDPGTITYLEFRADYHVELRFADGRTRTIPFLQLPISQLPGDFFPLTCRSCVDYTNVLADLTVRLTPPGSAGKRANAVRGFIANVARAAGGLPLRRMPQWLRPLVGWLMPRIGPRGLEFARTRLEMKAAETVLHLRREMPRRMKRMIPAHVWALMKPYGLERREGE